MGLAIVITRGGSIGTFPDSFLALGSGHILGVPVPFILFVISAFLVWVLLGHTRQGFYMYMVGSDPTVARFSGVNNKKVIIYTYVLVALLAGLAALVIASRVNSMRPGYGEAYLLPAILVAVLGGTDPDGGYGNVFGVVLAVFILQLTQSGLNILSFSPFLTKFLWGAALLLVLVINYLVPILRERGRLRKIRNEKQSQDMTTSVTLD
jgi:simple sugar transport system permease protein